MSKSVQDKLTRGAKLNFFLTGASGYIGLVVTEFAIAQDFSVRGLSRTEASDEKLRALAQESAVADAVIHLAWNLDWSVDYDKFIEAEVAAVNAICAAIKGTGKPLVVASECPGRL
ncbi:hypothetical protein C8R42DRAFT_774029 [Lentinula raphanica]|nr:hypothetical protein C8R42DRAFT_774029 [Lentinula raphanica]